MSERPDVFPAELCYRLQVFHHRAPTHSFGHTRRTVESELDAPLSTHFREFERLPEASGTVAQVHRAVLHDGSVVAVKVLHPNVERRVERDCQLLEAAVDVLCRLIRSASGYVGDDQAAAASESRMNTSSTPSSSGGPAGSGANTDTTTKN
jgi:predicted unusual protein kinase regulating ubiquinone biosynthesis (AarF/ABC1/UbiB family)